MTIEEKLKNLNIEIPKAPAPVGAYKAWTRSVYMVKPGKEHGLIFVSGQLPISSDGKIVKGKIGKDLTLKDGQNASRLCVINILAQLKDALSEPINSFNGDLNKINQCLKITGYVNSADNFIDQPKVINPASEILYEVFGSKHARAAISCNSLPLGVAVEIDAIFEFDNKI